MRKLNEQQYCGWCGSKVSYFAEWASECKKCGYKNYINPNPCSNIIVAKEDKVLLLKRAIKPEKDMYDLPGGYADVPDKSMEDAALRELREEIGVTQKDIKELKYLGSSKSPIYNWDNTAIENIAFYFITRLNSGVNIKLDAENQEYVWVEKKDIPKIDLAWDNDRQMLYKHFGITNE